LVGCVQVLHALRSSSPILVLGNISANPPICSLYSCIGNIRADPTIRMLACDPSSR
jgi:hypothetical protein